MERRRLTNDLYGLISTDRAGFQVVQNLPRGTVVELEQDETGATRVKAATRVFLPGKGDLERIKRASARL